MLSTFLNLKHSVLVGWLVAKLTTFGENGHLCTWTLYSQAFIIVNKSDKWVFVYLNKVVVEQLYALRVQLHTKEHKFIELLVAKMEFLFLFGFSVYRKKIGNLVIDKLMKKSESLLNWIALIFLSSLLRVKQTILYVHIKEKPHTYITIKFHYITMNLFVITGHYQSNLYITNNDPNLLNRKTFKIIRNN